MPLVIDPNPKGTGRVEDVIDDLSSALRKHGYVLGVHQQRPGVIILAKISDGVGNQATAVAEIQQIHPMNCVWRPVTADKKPFIIQ